MASKNGRMKIKCQAYRNAGRLQINKEIKTKKHQARMEHFAKRKAEGKSYEYVPPKTNKEKKLRAKKNVDRRLPIAKLDSIFSKLENELNRKKMEEKNKSFSKGRKKKQNEE